MTHAFDRAALSSALGNGAALFVGLVAAYAALAHSSGGQSDLLNIRTMDFMAYYSVGRLILAGHGAAMYDWTTVGPLQTALVGHVHTTFGILPYLYPPYFAIATAPLAALPYGAARLIWLAANCFLFAGTMAALERYARPTRVQAIAFRFGAVASLPVFLALITGQVSLVILALLTACVLLAREGRDGWAGVALGLVVMKPVYVIPVLLVALMYGRRRLLVSFGGTVVAIGLVAIPPYGPNIYGSFTRLMRQLSSWQGGSVHGPLWFHGQPVGPSAYAPVWNHSFWGFSELLGVSWWVGLTAVLSLMALAVVVWIARERVPLDLALAAAIPAGLLMSPHTLAYDLCALLIPAAALLRYRAELRQLIPWTLWFGYIAVTPGYLAGFFLRLQFSVVAGCMALACLAYVAWRLGARPAAVPDNSFAAVAVSAD